MVETAETNLITDKKKHHISPQLSPRFNFKLHYLLVIQHYVSLCLCENRGYNQGFARLRFFELTRLWLM